jgi:hypothetical protein
MLLHRVEGAQGISEVAPAFKAIATPRASAISCSLAPALRAASVWMAMQPSERVVPATAMEISWRTFSPRSELLEWAAERVC